MVDAGVFLFMKSLKIQRRAWEVCHPYSPGTKRSLFPARLIRLSWKSDSILKTMIIEQFLAIF